MTNYANDATDEPTDGEPTDDDPTTRPNAGPRGPHGEVGA